MIYIRISQGMTMASPFKMFVIMVSAVGVAACIAACGERDEASEDAAAPSPAVTTPAAATPAAAPGGAHTPAQATPAREGPRIVMLGDSLTAGFGLAERDALPARLEARLRADGVPATVINAGVSGDTTGGGLDRYDFSVRAADPDLVIVALGANDYLNGLAPERARANLAAIIEAAQADGAAVALVGVSPRGLTPQDGRDAAYAEIFPSLAAAYDVPLYPALLAGVADAPALLQADGLHPTAEGVEVIAAPLAAFVAAFVASSPIARGDADATER